MTNARVWFDKAPGRFTTKALEELDNGENDFVIQPTVVQCTVRTGGH